MTYLDMQVEGKRKNPFRWEIKPGGHSVCVDGVRDNKLCENQLNIFVN